MKICFIGFGVGGVFIEDPSPAIRTVHRISICVKIGSPGYQVLARIDFHIINAVLSPVGIRSQQLAVCTVTFRAGELFGLNKGTHLPGKAVRSDDQIAIGVRIFLRPDLAPGRINREQLCVALRPVGQVAAGVMIGSLPQVPAGVITVADLREVKVLRQRKSAVVIHIITPRYDSSGVVIRPQMKIRGYLGLGRPCQAQDCRQRQQENDSLCHLVHLFNFFACSMLMHTEDCFILSQVGRLCKYEPKGNGTPEKQMDWLTNAGLHGIIPSVSVC